jgi:hypothetical protein
VSTTYNPHIPTLFDPDIAPPDPDSPPTADVAPSNKATDFLGPYDSNEIDTIYNSSPDAPPGTATSNNDNYDGPPLV